MRSFFKIYLKDQERGYFKTHTMDKKQRQQWLDNLEGDLRFLFIEDQARRFTNVEDKECYVPLSNISFISEERVEESEYKKEDM